MKERPILFSGEMVRAILDGRKTQTRRLFKGIGPMGNKFTVESPEESLIELCENELRDHGSINYLSTGGLSGPYFCPYGKEKDYLWVRETFWQKLDFKEDQNGDRESYWTNKILGFAADGFKPKKEYCGKRPSIHMPRWASRITLEITGVRVERLQDISEEDAKAEGVEPYPVLVDDQPTAHYDEGFAQLWEKINGKGSWKQNPWVWVIEFKRV